MRTQAKGDRITSRRFWKKSGGVRSGTGEQNGKRHVQKYARPLG
jgi:hypothetical protein